MAAPNPPFAERCFGVTNIKNQIPVLLDEDEHNYDAWRELLLTHCMAFDVSGHLDGSVQLCSKEKVSPAPSKTPFGLFSVFSLGGVVPLFFKVEIPSSQRWVKVIVTRGALTSLLIGVVIIWDHVTRSDKKEKDWKNVVNYCECGVR